MSGARKRRTSSWAGGSKRQVPLVQRWTTCEQCGKRTFVSRKQAKAYARVAFPGDRGLNAYECPLGGTGYHIGHMPEPVKKGIEGRDAIITTPRLRAGHG